ncbi:NB-ARC domain-containing protein [Coleofasciculus sp. H7-2]|uniref:NB-ARC domain-containing protein n=1 Tax=Coleofasciculus sp. H7-2 TaxID=3351545 RepID=UPI00366D1464
MTVTEVLQLVDQLVFKHTGNHLNNLQKNVVEGIWQGKTYGEIAKEFGYNNENHIGNVSRELYKILSEQSGEDVNKSNFCWTLERLANSFNPSNSSQQQVGLINSHINLCSNSHKHDSKNTESSYSKKSYQDLTLAPKITYFCDRITELQTLSHWLTHQNTRLISVLGLSGIGKTTLVKQFIDLNLQQFDVIIWKSIKLSPLDGIITEILTVVNTDTIESNNKLTQVFHLLRQKRCLIIFDDLQELFTSGQFAGQYKTEYKDYKNFFTMMTEIEHQSSLILISQEQCQEMICLDEELYPVKCLEVQGLDNTEILKKLGLKDEESWLTLINLYEGNPVYLKDIASLIKNIFLGKVSEFLSENTLLLTEDIKFRFNELFDQLSAIEQQIVLNLSKSNQPMSREDLRQGLSLSSMDLINGLQSLKKRYLLRTTEEEKILFNLSPIFREYINTLSIG